MPTQKITREEWSTFFERFSRQHQGWLVSLERSGGIANEADRSANNVTLESITVDVREDARDAISITIAEGTDKHLTHTFPAPSRVVLEQTEEGAHEALHIEASDGEMAVLRFRTTTLPEMLDGVASD